MKEIYCIKYCNFPKYLEDLIVYELCAFSNKDKAQEIVDLLNKEDVTKQEILDIFHKYSDWKEEYQEYTAEELIEHGADIKEECPEAGWYFDIVRVFD